MLSGRTLLPYENASNSLTPKLISLKISRCLWFYVSNVCFPLCHWVYNWGQDILSPLLCVWAFLFAGCLSLYSQCGPCAPTPPSVAGVWHSRALFVFAQRQFVIDFVLSCLFLELKSWAEPQRSSGLWCWPLYMFLEVKVRCWSPRPCYCCCSVM